MSAPRARRAGGALLAGLLLAGLLLAGCGGSGGASATTASSGSVAPTGTAAPAATSGTVASPIAPGGLNVADLLGTGGGQPPETSWIRVADPAAPFSYEAPASWTQHSAHPWTEGDTTIGTSLAAGPDLAKLTIDFSVPGIVIGLSAGGAGITPRAVTEGGSGFAGCTDGGVHDASLALGSASYRLWSACGGTTGFLLVLAIAPAGQAGLIGIIQQGTTQAELGYLDHIVGSLAAASSGPATVPPAPSGSVSGSGYTISMDVCQNQHGQGVSGGLIRNDDTRIHTYRIVVAFSDPNGVFLNDTAWTTSDLQPGITARWQAEVPSGLPAVNVSCRITDVQLVS